MVQMCVSLRRLIQLSARVGLAVFMLTGSAASAQSSGNSTPTFAILAGTAVTCTNSSVTGDLGVWPGRAVTQTGCTLAGTVHAADAVAKRAYLDFINEYNDLRDNPPACDFTLTGTLAGETLLPGVYCVDAIAKTGVLTLDAQDDANATWTFLVNGALTGTNFSVVMINGGGTCNVDWWVRQAATLTDSHFLGTILAGEAITVTRGTFSGDVFATAAVTLTGATLTACQRTAGGDDGHGGNGHGGNVKKGKCNQGVGNGPEGCDPGNSNHRNPSNDERGGTPGNPGRKGGSKGK
jgi:hypothetical protein